MSAKSGLINKARRAGAPLLRATLLTLLLLALAIWLVIPHPVDFRHSFLENPGDPALYVATWRWQWRALTQGYIQQFWQGWFFYPNRWVMGYTEHILGLMPLYKLYEWVFQSPQAALWSVAVSLFVFDGWAGYLVGRRIGRSYAAGLAAAVVMSYSTFHFNQIAHMHVSAFFTVPLTLLALEDLLRNPTRRRGVVLGLIWGATPLVSYSNWATVSIAIPPFAIAWLALNLRRNVEKAVRKTALVRIATLLAFSALISLLMIAPMSIQFFKARSEIGVVGRSPEEIAAHSIQISDLLRPANRSIAYRYLPTPFGTNDKIERISYLGVSGVLLGIAGYFWPIGNVAVDYLRSRRKKAHRSGNPGEGAADARRSADSELVIELTPWFAAAFSGFLFMLGPEIRIRGSWPAIPGPFRLLSLIPGFSQLRAAGRFSLLIFIFVACCAAAAWRRFALRSRLGGPVIAAICAIWVFEAAIAVDQSGALAANLAEAPSYVRWLAQAERGPTVLIPMYRPGTPSSSEPEAVRLYLSTFDWQPRINGYSGYEPIGYRETVDDISYFPSERAMERLSYLRARYVVVEFPQTARYRRGGPDAAYYSWEYPDLPAMIAELRKEIAARPELVMRADFGDVGIYEIVR